MAQGKKYNDDIKEKAFALLAVNNNVSYVSKALDLPYSTVDTWRKQFIAQSEELEKKRKENLSSGNNEVYEDNEELDLVRLRKKKKEEFVENAWGLIQKVETLLERRLGRAIKSEDEIDELVDEICALDHKDLTDTQRKALYSRIASIKVESVKELSIVLGTLYDKQALANKEATAIVNGNINNTIKFEDL